MKKIKNRLKELLKQGVKLKEGDIKAQNLWASEAKTLIDMFLGPTPNNVHNQAYYEFCNAASHLDKCAILKAILLFPTSTNSFQQSTSSNFFNLERFTFWRFIKPAFRRVVVFLLVSSVLAGAWFAFVSIVAPIPIAPTPALIMVWMSVFVLLFVLFPNLLDKVKKIKVKDFELELQETVAKATSKDYLSIPDFDEHLFSTKGDFRNLGGIIEQALRFPNKPVLLVVNVRDDHYISIPMLFIYLFFLDLVGASVTLLFVSSKQSIRTVSDIRRDHILGAVWGKKVMRVFLERFPRLIRIFDFRRFNDNIRFEDFFRSGRFHSEGFEHFFHHLSDLLHDLGVNRSEYLSERDVENWFTPDLSRHAVELSISETDIKEIRQAISREDEFVIVLRDNKLNSVASICFLTRDMSRKLLDELTEKK